MFSSQEHFKQTVTGHIKIDEQRKNESLKSYLNRHFPSHQAVERKPHIIKYEEDCPFHGR
jgi:hypothetical protein